MWQHVVRDVAMRVLITQFHALFSTLKAHVAAHLVLTDSRRSVGKALLLERSNERGGSIDTA